MNAVVAPLMDAGNLMMHMSNEGHDYDSCITTARKLLFEYFYDGLGQPKLAEMMAMLGSHVAFHWAMSAFATIEPSHKLAASLMCTSVPSEVAQEAVLPWKAFCIAIPDGIFSGDETLVRYPPSAIFVTRFTESPYKHPEMGGSINIFSISSRNCAIVNVADLGKLTTVIRMEGFDDDLSLTPKAVDIGSKYQVLVDRLIIGCCLEMENGTSRSLSSITRKIKEKRGLPKAWVFKLTRSVKLDLRRHIYSYLNGTHALERNPLSVQILVRGHHKMQRYGPGHSGRKWIHIEPYWRGPEDAPIAVRPHVVKGL